MKRSEFLFINEIINELESLAIDLLNDVLNIEFDSKVIKKNCTSEKKDDLEDWEKGTFNAAEVFKA